MLYHIKPTFAMCILSSHHVFFVCLFRGFYLFLFIYNPLICDVFRPTILSCVKQISPESSLRHCHPPTIHFYLFIHSFNSFLRLEGVWGGGSKCCYRIQ